jgi:hypothetical protein
MNKWAYKKLPTRPETKSFWKLQKQKFQKGNFFNRKSRKAEEGRLNPSKQR